MPQGSGTAATMRKYVYTCFPGLVYNECQVTLLILQIYSSIYECTITATAKGCYPESGEMYQITLEKLSLILTSEFFFFKLSSLYDSDDYIIDNTANQMNCVG